MRRPRRTPVFGRRPMTLSTIPGTLRTPPPHPKMRRACNAYGSGAPPTPTSPNADMRTSPRAGSAPPTTATHYLDRHCITYSPAQRHRFTKCQQHQPKPSVATTQGTAPLTGRCTRYVALHLLWGAAPVQNGCIAYGSGAPPTPTSPNADIRASPRTGSTPLTTKPPQRTAAPQRTPSPRSVATTTRT